MACSTVFVAQVCAPLDTRCASNEQESLPCPSKNIDDHGAASSQGAADAPANTSSMAALTVFGPLSPLTPRRPLRVGEYVVVIARDDERFGLTGQFECLLLFCRNHAHAHLTTFTEVRDGNN